MSRLLHLLSATSVALFVAGCGGGGGGEGSQLGKLSFSADFADPTREVPGYADCLRVTVTPPEGVSLPQGAEVPISLTRTATTFLLDRLTPSVSPYLLKMDALTDGAVVGTAQRTVFITAGSSQEIDVSANLHCEIDGVEVEGPLTINMGHNTQYTAYAMDAQGQMLFSGLGFTWTSSNPLVLFVDVESGFANPRSPGTSTLKATLTGTNFSASMQVQVLSAGGVGVTVEPATATVGTNAQKQFTAVVTGSSDQSVTWTIDEPDGGSISSSGMYSAPGTLGEFTIRATSQADPTVSGTAVVTVAFGEGWTIINLHPPGAKDSFAEDICDGQQVGSYIPLNSGYHRAALWTGSAESFVSLHPSNAVSSRAVAVGNGRQGGTAHFPFIRAALWEGPELPCVYLDPPNSSECNVYAIDGNAQGGYVWRGVNGQYHASIWTLTPQSWVDIHPVGATGSSVRGMHAGQQVGEAEFNEYRSAALWSGTAASYVDLHPDGVGCTSCLALGIHNGQIVGRAQIQEGTSGSHHASLWTGSSASWVDLHPAGAISSNAYDVYDGVQVGRTTSSAVETAAALWRGTAASYINLHALLPARFERSEANGVWNDGSYVYVVGQARVATTQRWEAIMWVAPVGSL